MTVCKKSAAAALCLLLLLTGCSRRPAAAAVPEGPAVSAAMETPAPETPPAEEAVSETAAPAPEAAPEPTTEATPEPAPAYPDVDITSWEFLLANAEHGIGEYQPELETVENGQKFDTRAAQALRDFIAGAREAGQSVYLSSAYRSYAEQSYLYERKVNQYGGDRAKAATIVLPPGTSEHQTGLSADITDRYYEMKTDALENTALFQWMLANCAEYGFILRYPLGKGEITGVIYEPWHFRYVGQTAARYIMDEGLCLEEFLALYETEAPK